MNSKHHSIRNVAPAVAATILDRTAERAAGGLVLLAILLAGLFAAGTARADMLTAGVLADCTAAETPKP